MGASGRSREEGSGSDWASGAVTVQVVRAVVTVGALAVLSRIVMAGRDVVLADRFGTGDAVDAFVVAQILPLFAAQVVSGALPAALVPTYAGVEESEGRDAAVRLVQTTGALNAVLVFGCAVLLAAVAPLLLPLLGSGFDVRKLALTRSLFVALIPVLVFTGMSVVWAAVLNTHRRFVLAAALPALAPFGAILMLVGGPRSWGVHGAAWGMTAGSACEALLLAVALSRRGISPLPRWNGFDEHQRAVWHQYLPAAGGALLLSTTVVVDQAVAATRGHGSVAALNYGGKVVSFLTGTGSVALGTVVLPHISAMAARRDWRAVRRAVRSYVLLVTAVSVPATFAVIAVSHPLAGALFERGAFTGRDTNLVSRIQAMYMLQVPSFLLGIVGVRVLGALRRNHVLIAIAAVNVVVNLVTDLLFLWWLGIPGIALSTSVVYLLSATAIFVAVSRALRAEEKRQIYE